MRRETSIVSYFESGENSKSVTRPLLRASVQGSQYTRQLPGMGGTYSKTRPHPLQTICRVFWRSFARSASRSRSHCFRVTRIGPLPQQVQHFREPRHVWHVPRNLACRELRASFEAQGEHLAKSRVIGIRVSEIQYTRSDFVRIRKPPFSSRVSHQGHQQPPIRTRAATITRTVHTSIPAQPACNIVSTPKTRYGRCRSFLQRP